MHISRTIMHMKVIFIHTMQFCACRAPKSPLCPGGCAAVIQAVLLFSLPQDWYAADCPLRVLSAGKPSGY